MSMDRIAVCIENCHVPSSNLHKNAPKRTLTVSYDFNPEAAGPFFTKYLNAHTHIQFVSHLKGIAHNNSATG